MPINLSNLHRKVIKSHEKFHANPADRAIVKEVVARIEQSTNELPEWFSYYSRNHSERISFDLALTRKYVKNEDKIIEFGSTPLLLTGAIARSGFDITGSDIDPSRFAPAAKNLGLRIVKCDLEGQAFPFMDESFDVAIFNEIFEHLRINLIHTFEEVHRILKPGGRLMLSTPNGRSYARLTGLLLHDRALDSSIFNSYKDLDLIGHMGHVREYTVTDVIEFLNSVGFECEEVVYRGRFPGNSGQVFARLFPSLRPFFSVIAKRL